MERIMYLLLIWLDIKVMIQQQLSATGCVTAILLNFLVSGRAFITPILNPSNSRGFERKLA